MAFRPLEKGTLSFAEKLPEGCASIDRRGGIRFYKSDLALVGIEDQVLILTDEASMRIAFRKPRPNETKNAYRVSVATIGFNNRKQEDQGHRRILIRRALEELRVEPEAAAGRYEVLTKDDLVIVQLTDMAGSKKPADEEEDGGEE